MGLDMYLYKIKKCGDLTPKQIFATYDNMRAKENGYTLEEWCGGNPNDVREDMEDAIRAMIHKTIPAYVDGSWTNYQPREEMYDIVAYWRKANQIHNWFVNNVQDGNDDCGLYEVSEDKLRELRDIATKVLNASELIDGKIQNGESLENGKWIANMVDGKVIKNSEVAEDLLPTTSGFFFGSTDYDEYYVDDLETTIEQLTKVLNETDFTTETICYASSW